MSKFVEQLANYVRFEINGFAKRKLDMERRRSFKLWQAETRVC